MSLLQPKLNFIYLARHYTTNFLALLIGLSLVFAIIDYFQNSTELVASSNHTIMYLFYIWQEALALLYPLSIVLAGVMTVVMLIKNGNMTALHSFGYTKRHLVLPLLSVAVLVYLGFTVLHTTEFSYAKDKADAMLAQNINPYAVDNLFFIYKGDFVYAQKLDPVKKTMQNISLFKLAGNDLLYTIHAKEAHFNGEDWEARDILTKRLIYDKEGLQKHDTIKSATLTTLKGYKPHMIESIHEGKALNIIDGYEAFRLLGDQHLNTKKIRSTLYQKIVFPLFSIALLLIFFFKMPFLTRYMNLQLVLALWLAVIFVLWGMLFALDHIGHNGVLLPEVAILIPVLLLWIYALALWVKNKEVI